MADAKKLRGFKWDSNNTYLEVWVNGTEIARFDDATNDLRVLTLGVTIDSGGYTNTAGDIVVDDTTTCTTSTSGSITSAGGLGVVKDVHVGGTCTIGGKITYADVFEHANAVIETVTDCKDLDNLDSGKIFHCATDSKIFNLPAMCDGTLLGATYTIVNTAADAGALVSVNPGTADYICGNDIGGVDGKEIRNTKSSHKDGDMIRLVCGGSFGWIIEDVIGTWAAEA